MCKTNAPFPIRHISIMKLILVLSVLLASTAIAIPAGTTLSPVVARREENLFKLSKRVRALCSISELFLTFPDLWHFS